MSADTVHGEGNYKAARDYDEAASAFAKDKDRVKKAAQEAEDAIEGAEAEGRSRPKG